jgi:hypothetical protein
LGGGKYDVRICCAFLIHKFRRMGFTVRYLGQGFIVSWENCVDEQREKFAHAFLDDELNKTRKILDFGTNNDSNNKIQHSSLTAHDGSRPGSQAPQQLDANQRVAPNGGRVDNFSEFKGSYVEPIQSTIEYKPRGKPNFPIVKKYQ